MSSEIIQRVAACLAQVLAMEKDEIEPQARVMDDLGADSLDLVELMFLLEQEFNITLSEKDMSLSAQLGLSDDEIHENEVLTPEALELLRERYPSAADQLVEGTTRRFLASLITPAEIAAAVEKKLSVAAANPAASA